MFFNFDLSFGNERTTIKSKDFVLNGSIFMGNCNKDISKNCIVTFKILSFTLNEL